MRKVFCRRMIQTTKDKNQITGEINFEEFPTTIGVEYALVPKGQYYDYWSDTLTRKLQSEVNSFLDQNNITNISKAKSECGAVEVSSNIIRSKKELIEFWNISNKAFSSCSRKMVANTTGKNKHDGESYYIEGGGGHIHIGIQKKDREHIYDNFTIGLLNRPYIAWMFSEFCDDDSLPSSFFNAMEIFVGNNIENYTEGLIKATSRDYRLEWGMGPTQTRNVAACIYDKPVKNTVEIRCFAAYKNLQQLVDYVDFSLALYEYFKCHNQLQVIATDTRTNHIKYCNGAMKDPRSIITEFNTFLQRIGLNPERYKRYQINFKNRIKYGKLHTFEERSKRLDC